MRRRRTSFGNLPALQRRVGLPILGFMHARDGARLPVFGSDEFGDRYVMVGENWLQTLGSGAVNVVNKVVAEFKHSGGSRGKWTLDDYERDRRRTRKALSAAVKSLRKTERLRAAAAAEVKALRAENASLKAADKSKPQPEDDDDDYGYTPIGVRRRGAPAKRGRALPAPASPPEIGWNRAEINGSMRIELSGDHRAGVVDLGGGMYLVAEMPEAVLGANPPAAVSRALDAKAKAAVNAPVGTPLTHWTADLVGGQL